MGNFVLCTFSSDKRCTKFLFNKSKLYKRIHSKYAVCSIYAYRPFRYAQLKKKKY